MNKLSTIIYGGREGRTSMRPFSNIWPRIESQKSLPRIRYRLNNNIIRFGSCDVITVVLRFALGVAAYWESSIGVKSNRYIIYYDFQSCVYAHFYTWVFCGGSWGVFLHIIWYKLENIMIFIFIFQTPFWPTDIWYFSPERIAHNLLYYNVYSTVFFCFVFVNYYVMCAGRRRKRVPKRTCETGRS